MEHAYTTLILPDGYFLHVDGLFIHSFDARQGVRFFMGNLGIPMFVEIYW
jgi:hypothetical protein